MTQWSERYKSHQVWQLLQNLGPAIDNAFNREGTDPETLDGIARLKSILTFVGRRLAGDDPYLFQAVSLDNLGSALQAVTQEVQNFVANGSVGHIANANSHGDAALTHLAQINVQLTTEDFMAAKEAAESYRVGLEKALSVVTGTASQLSGEIASLRTRITELSTELTAERTRLSTTASEFQTQFSTAQESRSGTFATDQKERQDRYTALFTEFTQKLGEQNTEFTKQREDIARLHQSELAELKKQFVDESTALHEEILKRKTEVEKLVGVIGNLGVTSGYLTTAKEAKITVRVWQVITVVTMFLLIAIAYKAFLPAIKAEFSWPGFAGRVFVALTVGTLAAYAGTQADKYQKIERYNRRLALELEAIGPFIAPLSEDKQADFRIKVGDRSFGQIEGAHSELDAKSPTSVADIILNDPKVRSFIIDIIKATKP
jgi:predicted  nucleic acid-binding Zn-ribbon protein